MKVTFSELKYIFNTLNFATTYDPYKAKLDDAVNKFKMQKQGRLEHEGWDKLRKNIALRNKDRYVNQVTFNTNFSELLLVDFAFPRHI